jgi:hypothetical protein
MEDKYSNTLFQIIEDKKLHYGEDLRSLISTITRTSSSINTEDHRVFGKHIHAFCWAFFHGVYYKKKETPDNWSYTDTFSIGTFYRDQGSIVADAMVMIALGELESKDFEKTITTQSGIRNILNIISSYAEGGAKHIMEIRDTDSTSNYLDAPYHFFDEINNRIKDEKKKEKVLA